MKKRKAMNTKQKLSAELKFISENQQLSGFSGHISRQAHKLQPLPPRVIHEEQRHAVVPRQVPGGEQLAVASKIGEGEHVGFDDLEEAFGTTPVLDIGPPIASDRSHVETIALAYKGNLLLS